MLRGAGGCVRCSLHVRRVPEVSVKPIDEDFFSVPPPGPNRDQHRPPEWFQPPTDQFAALVAERSILARDAGRGTAVALSHIDVFTNGCVLRIRASLHRQPGMSEGEWLDRHDSAMNLRRRLRRDDDGELPDDLLRFGVRYRDGSKATTTDPPQHHDRHVSPAGPVLTMQGGGGGGGQDLMTVRSPLWLWPLPPPEPFDLVFEWPGQGIPLSSVELDGARIVEAAVDAGPYFGGGH